DAQLFILAIQNGHYLRNSNSTKSETIDKTIKFVEEVMLDETLTKTQIARYTAVLYFLRLRLINKKKVEAANMVSEVVNGGPWLVRCIRKWANICMKGELIQPTAQGRFPSKSLLNDELVSFQLAAYLHTQTFEVSPRMLMSKWLDKDCIIRTFPCLNDNEREHVWITHDKTTFYAYEGPRALWGPENEQPLCKKGMGL
ncbi:8668_t:CDS:2, partial [Acaulospora morrowiae]